MIQINDLNSFLKNKTNLRKLLIYVFVSLSIPLALVAFNTFRDYIKKAAQYGASFSFSPSGNQTITQEEKKLVTLYLDPQAFGSVDPGFISSLEFVINYNFNEVKIVDQYGVNVSSVTIEDGQGDVFAGRVQGLNPGNYFVAINQVGQVADDPQTPEIESGQIHFAVGIIPLNDSDKGYGGVPAPFVSFYVTPQIGSGSTTLSFKTVIADDPATPGFDESATDMMHALSTSIPGEVDPVDILLPDMNGAVGSSLILSIPTVSPTLSLSGPTEVTAGSDFDVTIQADSAGLDVIGIDAVLKYNSNLVTLNSYDPAVPGMFDSYQAITQIPNPLPPPSEVPLISGYNINHGYNGSGNFATVHFTAGQTLGPTSIDLVFVEQSPTRTNDSNILKYISGVPITESQDILASVVNLSLNIISGASPTPTPTLTSTPTPTRTPTPTPVPPTNTPTPTRTPTPTPVPPTNTPTPTRTPTPTPVPPTNTPTPTRTPTPTPTNTPTSTPTNTPTPTRTPTPTPTPLPVCNDCPADVNDDGEVNSVDVSIIAAGWGVKWNLPGFPTPACPIDLNNDGLVNSADIQILVSWWGWVAP